MGGVVCNPGSSELKQDQKIHTPFEVLSGHHLEESFQPSNKDIVITRYYR